MGGAAADSAAAAEEAGAEGAVVAVVAAFHVVAEAAEAACLAAAAVAGISLAGRQVYRGQAGAARSVDRAAGGNRLESFQPLEVEVAAVCVPAAAISVVPTPAVAGRGILVTSPIDRAVIILVVALLRRAICNASSTCLVVEAEARDRDRVRAAPVRWPAVCWQAARRDSFCMTIHRPSLRGRARVISPAVGRQRCRAVCVLAAEAKVCVLAVVKGCALAEVEMVYDLVAITDRGDPAQAAAENKCVRVTTFDRDDRATTTGQFGPVKAAVVNNGSREIGRIIDQIAFLIVINGTIGETIIATMFGPTGTTTGRSTIIGTTTIGGITIMCTIRTIQISITGVTRRGPR